MVVMPVVVRKMIVINNNHMKDKIVIIFISVILLSCNNPNPLLIVQGKGIGEFKIGKKLPKTDYNKKDFTIILNKKDNTIRQIEILSDKYYTQKKIKIGDSYKDVIYKYGEPNEEIVLEKGNHRYPKEKNKISKIRNLWYKGILFMIDKEKEVVKSIRVF